MKCRQGIVDEDEGLSICQIRLRALDLALLSFGATRGTLAEGNAKSPARLLCPPERRHEVLDWATACVRHTVLVLHLDDITSASLRLQGVSDW